MRASYHFKGIVTLAIAGGCSGAALLASQGCTTEPWVSVFECLPDADPEAGYEGHCFQDGGTVDPASWKCEDRGGQCVDLGTSDFTDAVLLWVGEEDEESAPQCPDRAPSLFYTGYSDLLIDQPCDKCSCGPATCALPGAIEVYDSAFCGGASTSYQGPESWDGSCVSPSVLPSGSFDSIKLSAPALTGCEPLGAPEHKPPGFAPKRRSFGGGVYWGKYAKACRGVAQGMCESSGDTCVPSTEPPPPEFRQCVQYLRDANEGLPQCPEAFPEQFVFYSATKGEVTCTACSCGEPEGGNCKASVSAYQDLSCGSAPMPLFEGVPASQGTCIDLAGMPYALGSMSSKWIANEPGTCQPIGGELIGEVKGADPRVFCCQEKAAPPAPPPQ